MSDDGSEALIGCGCLIVAATAWLLFLYVAVNLIDRVMQ